MVGLPYVLARVQQKYCMSLNQILASFTTRSDPRLHLNATVRQDIGGMEENISNFRKAAEAQRKCQVDIQLALKKLEEEGKTNLQQMHRDLSDRIIQLTQALRTESRGQAKELQYLQLQSTSLNAEHERLLELAGQLVSKAQQVDSNVGA